MCSLTVELLGGGAGGVVPFRVLNDSHRQCAVKQTESALNIFLHPKRGFVLILCDAWLLQICYRHITIANSTEYCEILIHRCWACP